MGRTLGRGCLSQKPKFCGKDGEGRCQKSSTVPEEHLLTSSHLKHDGQKLHRINFKQQKGKFQDGGPCMGR